MSIRVAFFGTPDVAGVALTTLLSQPDIDVEVVVTNPDRPKGRGRTVAAPPVKSIGQAAGCVVWQPSHPRDILRDLSDVRPDVCAVVAYGSILSSQLLATSRLGFVNLHFSLLPRWRGAAPVQHALRAGDTTTGVTVFVLDEGMDTGPIIRQVAEPIREEDNAGSLLTRLAHIGADVLAESIVELAGGAVPHAQPSNGVTYAPKVSTADLAIDWHQSATVIRNLVRSAAPAPGAWTTYDSKRLKLFETTVGRDDRQAASRCAPGTIVDVANGELSVQCAQDVLRIHELQLEGKARMASDAFINGQQPQVGEVVGKGA